MIFKYLIIDYKGLEVPVLFSKLIQHDKMAEGKKVVSAGFIQMRTNHEITCYGESVSLNIKSRGITDAMIFEADGLFKV